MKSKSPFAIKSPLRIQVYGGDTYESPDTVITKTVGEQVGAAITGLSKNATKYMDDYKKPEPRKKVKSVNSITPDRGQVPERGISTAGKLSSKTSNKIQYIKTGGRSEAQAWENRDRVKYPEDSKDQFIKDMRADPSYGKGGNVIKQNLTSTSIYGDGKLISKTPYSPTSMKGSPNKLIGDTMDPYGQINPGAVPPNQAQNDLGAQPIISADGSQPSARAIDMAAIENPYATPGADFNPQSKIKAESIFGSPMQRQGSMNLGTPLHDKGHANDYEGHTHRTKGGSYKEGDYMDETDMETSYPKLYTQDVGEIKRDKKSQFMVSKNEDYSPTKIDTIRPLKGKEFKMGWGDAERNISTNPKYKKSK